MRGLVFSEFLEFVEEQAGPETVETMLDACDLDSGGAYTTVGFYDHDELLQMLGFLNRATGQEVSEMVRAFGRHLFGQLAESHPQFVGESARLLDFLEGIETHIHTEVRKLYPDAELPLFQAVRPDEGTLVLHYKSARPFADLAHGMIQGAGDWFGNALDVTRTDDPDLGGRSTTFEIRAA